VSEIGNRLHIDGDTAGPGAAARRLENPFRADIGNRLAAARSPLALTQMEWDAGREAWRHSTLTGRPSLPALLQNRALAADVTDHGLALYPLALDGRFYVRLGGSMKSAAGDWRLEPGPDDVTRTVLVRPGAVVLTADAGARGRADVTIALAPDRPIAVARLRLSGRDIECAAELSWLPGTLEERGEGIWLLPHDPGELDPVIARNNSAVPDPPRPRDLPAAGLYVLPIGASLMPRARSCVEGNIGIADRAFAGEHVERVALGRWDAGEHALLLVVARGAGEAESIAAEWLAGSSLEQEQSSYWDRLAERLSVSLPDERLSRQARFSLHNSLFSRARRDDGREIFVHGRRERGYGDCAHLHQSYQMHLPALACGEGESVRVELETFLELQEDDGDLARAPRPGAGSHPYVGLYSNAHLLLALHRYLAWTGDRDFLDAEVGGERVLARACRAADFLLARRSDGLLAPCGWLDAWPPDVRAQSQITAAGLMGLDALAKVLDWRGADGGARYAAAAAKLRQRLLERCYDVETGLFAEHVFADGVQGGTADDFWAHTQIWAALAGVAPDERGLDATRTKCLGSGMRVVPVSTFDSGYVAASTDGDASLSIDSTATWLLASWPELTHLYALAEVRAGRAELALAAVESQLPEVLHRRNAAAAPFYYAEKYLTPGDEPWLCTWAGDPTLIDVLLTGFLGVRPDLEGLRIEPCLPSQWNGEAIVADFAWRGADWRLMLDTAAKTLTVDGVETNGPLIAPAEQGTRHVIHAPAEERTLHG
jgi:hypothetical protein